MGYRNYIGEISKEDYNLIKDFTLEEAFKHFDGETEEDPYISAFDICKTELYCLGKNCDFTEEFHKPFFTNEELQEYMVDEQDFYVVPKEFLASVIDSYANRIKDYYRDLMENAIVGEGKETSVDETKAALMYEHIRGLTWEWTQVKPHCMDDSDKITRSWRYEYAIFELVRIYKTFDWKNNIMIYYGY